MKRQKVSYAATHLLPFSKKLLQLTQSLEKVLVIWHLCGCVHYFDIADDALFVDHKERTLWHTCLVADTVCVYYLSLWVEVGEQRE